MSTVRHWFQQLAPVKAVRHQIWRLDLETHLFERRRKVILLSKIAAIAGVLVSAHRLTGILRPDATVMIVSIAAAVGGAAGLGSTTTTTTTTTTAAAHHAAAIKDAEARRAKRIGMIRLTVVGDGPSRH
jgi:hypothetical protein